MGATTTKYKRGTAKNIKMNIPKTPIMKDNNQKGFRKGMREKLLDKLKKEKK